MHTVCIAILLLLSRRVCVHRLQKLSDTQKVNIFTSISITPHTSSPNNTEISIHHFRQPYVCVCVCFVAVSDGIVVDRTVLTVVSDLYQHTTNCKGNPFECALRCLTCTPLVDPSVWQACCKKSSYMIFRYGAHVRGEQTQGSLECYIALAFFRLSVLLRVHEITSQLRVWKYCHSRIRRPFDILATLFLGASYCA